MATASIAGEILPKGVTTVIWTVDDGNGQTTNCTAVITVEDNEVPEITCFGDTIKSTDTGDCTYTVQLTEFDATFTDNCSDGSITNDLNNTDTLAGAILPKGVTTVISARKYRFTVQMLTVTVNVEENALRVAVVSKHYGTM